MNSTTVTPHYMVFFNVIPMVTIVTGVIGNSITIFVLTKKENKKSSSAILYVILAISDTGILMVNIFPGWLIATFPEACLPCGMDLRTLSYFRMIFLETSSWIVCLITLERLVCVLLPIKARMTSSPVFAVAAVCATLTALAIINSMYFLLDYRQNHLHMQIVIWVGSVLEFILPAVIIVSGNAIIIVSLSRQRIRMRAVRSGFGDTSVTRRLIIVSVAFIVTMTPSFVYDVLNVQGVIIHSAFWRDSLASLSNTNAAINFYLYVLQGTKFRAQVKESLCCFSNVCTMPSLPAGRNRACVNEAYVETTSSTTPINTITPSFTMSELIPRERNAEI